MTDSKYHLHIGLGLLGSTGGTTQAVSDFQSALEPGTVVAISDHDSLEKEGPFCKDWIYLKRRQSFLGRHYYTADRTAEEIILRDLPNLGSVFCHMLYRYNSNLTVQISKVRNVPYFVVPHGSLDPWVFTYRGWQKKSWLTLYGKEFLRNAAAVIFASEAEKRKACKAVSISNGVVIHWPVDERKTRPSAVERIELRKKLGIPPGGRVLLMFGRVHSSKRPLETLRAIASANCVDLHVIVMGPSYDISMEDCKHAIGRMVPQMHWVGPVYGEEKWTYIAAADGYITLSEKENFNYCLAECLSAGLPSIMSPGNDLAGELRPVECGWMLSDNTEENAVSAIKEFCSASKDSLLEMGENGRRFASRELTRDVFKQQLVSLVKTHSRRGI